MKKRKILFVIITIMCFFYSCEEKVEPTGWWKICLSNGDGKEMDLQPWGIRDTTIIKIENGVMEVLDGIDIPPHHYYGNHCPLYLSNKSYFVFNLHSRTWQKYDFLNSGSNLIQIKDESGRMVELQRIPPLASVSNSSIHIDSIKMVITDDSLAMKENPMADELVFTFNSKTYSVKSSSIYKLNDAKKIIKPLSRADIEYITVLSQRVFNENQKDLSFEQKISDSPKTVVEVYTSNGKLTIEAGDPFSIPKPVGYLIKFLARFKC